MLKLQSFEQSLGRKCCAFFANKNNLERRTEAGASPFAPFVPAKERLGLSDTTFAPVDDTPPIVWRAGARRDTVVVPLCVGRIIMTDRAQNDGNAHKVNGDSFEFLQYHEFGKISCV